MTTRGGDSNSVAVHVVVRSQEGWPATPISGTNKLQQWVPITCCCSYPSLLSLSMLFILPSSPFTPHAHLTNCSLTHMSRGTPTIRFPFFLYLSASECCSITVAFPVPCMVVPTLIIFPVGEHVCLLILYSYVFWIALLEVALFFMW